MSPQSNSSRPGSVRKLLQVPDGLTRCAVCNEYRGVMALNDLPGFSSSIYRDEDPRTPLTVSCICDGILCGTCKKNRIHRPISNSWSERGGFGHWPYFSAMIPCDDCRAKKEAEEHDVRHARKTQPIVRDLHGEDSEEENHAGFLRHWGRPRKNV